MDVEDTVGASAGNRLAMSSWESPVVAGYLPAPESGGEIIFLHNVVVIGTLCSGSLWENSTRCGVY